MDPSAGPPVVVIPPAKGPHTHTVVFLHGRGDSAAVFAQSIHYFNTSENRSLQEIFPTFRWVFPQAPTETPLCRPKDKVNQWFDIWNVQDFGDKEELQRDGLKASVTRVAKLLEREAGILGGHWDRIVLAGISQGGATSVHTLLNLGIQAASGGSAGGGAEAGKPRLGAFLGFSCRLPFPRDTVAEVRKELGLWEGGDEGRSEMLLNTPILLEHCVDDPLVKVESGQQLRDKLLEFGAQVTWKEYPNGGHWFNSPTGAEDVVKFLKDVFQLSYTPTRALVPTEFLGWMGA